MLRLGRSGHSPSTSPRPRCGRSRRSGGLIVEELHSACRRVVVVEDERLLANPSPHRDADLVYRPGDVVVRRVHRGERRQHLDDSRAGAALARGEGIVVGDWPQPRLPERQQTYRLLGCWVWGGQGRSSRAAASAA